MKTWRRKPVSKLRWTIRLFLLGGLLVFFCTYHQVRALKLLAPTWFGMKAIADRVYVDKAMPSFQQEEILQVVSGAQSRVRNYYGEVNTSPKLFFCSDEKVFQSLGGSRETGMSYFSRASVFSPRGLSVPIVAHEWSHAEFYARVGIRAWLHVPRWFDEGLAVTVSEEPRHAESVYQEALQAGASPPKLSELETMRQWSQAVKKYRDPKLNPGDRALVYATVGHEVRNWFGRVGTDGLTEFCRSLRSGTNFSTAYESKIKK